MSQLKLQNYKQICGHIINNNMSLNVRTKTHKTSHNFRSYSNDNKNNSRNILGIINKTMELPLIMNFLPKVFPNKFHSIRNGFMINLYIKPFIDKEFNFNHFLSGAQQV